MFRRLFRRRPTEAPPQPPRAAEAPLPPVRASATPPLPAQADPRRLEIYLGQIADLPEHDRAIIIGVLQGILDEEATGEQAITDL
ncbi:MAG: hypothetical protein M3Z04_01355 [Chloroflexota bacterium]|nr:hypothetical protein [Chloroflexota bacterium]